MIVDHHAYIYQTHHTNSIEPVWLSYFEFLCFALYLNVTPKLNLNMRFTFLKFQLNIIVLKIHVFFFLNIKIELKNSFT